MKRIYAILSALVISATLWAAIVPTTFTYTDFTGQGTSTSGSKISATKNQVSFVSTKGYGTSEHVRNYSGSIFTISAAQPISKIEITCTASGTSNNGPGKISNETENSKYSYSGAVGTWVPNENQEITSVSLKCSAQVRFTQVVVYSGTEDVVVNSLSLNLDTLRLDEGKQQTLVATVDPAGTKLKWTSTNAEVATVDKNGLVSASTPGETKIAVSAGDKSDTCVVIVSGSGEFVWYNILTADNMQYLKNGDKVMIAAKSGAALMGQWVSGTNIASIKDGLTFNDDKSKCKELSAAVYTLIKDGDKWNLKDASGKYLAINAAKNIGAVDKVGTNAQLSFTFSGSSLKIQSNTSYGYLQYNSQASIFNSYTSYQGDVSLYFRHDEYAGELSVSPAELTFPAQHLKNGEATDTLSIDVQFKNLDEMGVLPEIKNVSSDGVEFTIVGSPESITSSGQLRVAYYALEEGEFTAQLNLQALSLDGQEWNINVPLSAKVLAEEIVLTPITIQQAYDSLAKEVGNWGNSTNATGKKEYVLGDVTVTGHAGNYLFVKDATGSLCIYDDQNRTHAEGVFYPNGDVLTGLRGTMKVAANAVEMLPAEGYQPTKKSGTVITPDTILSVLDVTREGHNVNRYVVAQGVTFAEIKTLEKYYDEVNFSLDGTAAVLKNYLVKNLGAVDTQKAHYDIEGFVWANGKQMQLIANSITVSKSFVQHVSEVTLSPNTATMQISEQITLTPTVAPADAANKKVIWSVKHDCVSVADGVVTALKAGTDTVVVTTEDGGLTAECAIVVTEPESLHPGATIYQKVTKAADLKAGEHYLIIYETGKVAAGEWQINTGGDKGKYAAAEAKIINNQATAPTAMVFTLGGTTDAWTLQDTTGGYLYFTSTGNGYMLRDGNSSNTWTIAATGDAIISNDYNTRAIRFNTALPAGGGQIFTNYAKNGQTSIQLYYDTKQVTPSGIPATGIVLTEQDVTIRVNEQKQLTAMVQPANADESEKEIVWTVKDAAEGISVTDGLVVATAKGEYDIIATLAQHTNLADTCHIIVKDSVHVTGITLERTTATVVETQSVQLTATIAPADADNKQVTWTSSDEGIATVDANGLVSALRYGEVLITAASDEYPAMQATCTLTVTALAGDRYHLMTKDSVLNDGDLIVFYNNDKQSASAGLVDSKKYLSGTPAIKAGNDLVIEQSEPMLLTKNGNYWQLSINGSPIGHAVTSDNSVDFNGKYSDFTITVNDQTLAVVKSQTASNPQFYCNTSGAFRLYNSTSMSPIQLYRKVATPDVPIAVEDVELDADTLYLRAGEQDVLTATVLPADAKNKEVEWGCLNEGVAMVDKGVVSAIAQGETKVWVRTVDGGFTDTCFVKIYASIDQPDVTWNQLQSLDSLKEGTRVFFASVKAGENYVMGIYDYATSKSNIRGAAATFSDDRHQVTASQSYAYTVHIDNGKYVFTDLDGSYLCDYNAKNLSAQDNLDNKARWAGAVTKDFAFTFTNIYNTDYVIYNNHNSDVFCCYNAYDQSNMSYIAIYSDNAPEWKEPELHPEWTILCNKDTVKDTLDWGKVVYDDTWGTEENPYQESKTLTFVTQDLTQPITLVLKKGLDFVLYTSSIPAKGGTATVNFSVVSVGTYTDTLVVTCGDITRKVVLKAQAVKQEDVKPAITLSTKQVYLNPNYQDGTDITMFTFTTTNMVKNLYIKWENTTGNSIPDRQGESVEILAETEYVNYGQTTNMGAVNYTDAEVLISATAYTIGTYTSSLLFYTPDANDKSKNAFEERVNITICVTEEPTPTGIRDLDAAVQPIKFIHNNHLYIYRLGKWYMVNGQIVNK